MQFALIGDDGTFGQDYQFLAFDLDRNGVLDLDTLDGPELFHGFEKAITLDGRGYSISASLDGAALTLRPLASPPPPRPALAVGTLAPDIAITSLDGRRVTLSSLRGKLVLLDFWATSCKPCIEAMPALAALRDRYAPRGFELLSIAAESDDVRAKVGDHPAGIVAIDEAAQATYRVDRFPMYFLVGRDGTIACSHCRLDKITQLLEQLR
jgi:thiol-disulfide isomerase/thioredoxin